MTVMRSKAVKDYFQRRGGASPSARGELRKQECAMSEAQLHRSVAAFLRQALKPPTTWTTMPAGGGGRIRGAQLKAMGLQPGWPDLVVIHRLPARAHVGSIVAGIELKTKKGSQSVEQESVQKEFENAGCLYYVARSLEEVEGFLRGAGIPLHATVSA